MDDLPDPISEETFQRSKLDWSRAASPEGRRQMDFVRNLARLRQAHITPLLAGVGTAKPHILPAEDNVLAIDWRFPEATLGIRANFAAGEKSLPLPEGDVIFAFPERESPGPSIVVAIDTSIRRAIGTNTRFDGS